ncbi:MAG: hypothetical protein JSW52_04165 [Candidatus Coatesbacteria bacterium]|nr:MAG: hypothetical protein JSW52_04165 [Candidatus Coatesbacteria bacterium]
MNKIIYVTLAALALWGAGANAHAASPVVAAEYDLLGPFGNSFFDVTTSANGLAVFRWDTFEHEPFPGVVAVMKNAGEPFVASDLITVALNSDWSKIAVSWVYHITGAAGPEEEYADDVEKVAREIGVRPEEVDAASYGDGFKGDSWVSRPVIVDLETGAETPLAIAGGDFLYWLNDDELVIGRETSGLRCEALGTMEAIKYDLRTGESETFASEDLPPLLNERCTVPIRNAQRGRLNPPYTSKDWGTLPAACIYGLDEPAPPVAVPSRGGQLESDEGAIYWVPAAGGHPVKVAAGNALAASDDGVWLFVRSEPEPLWDWFTVEGFYALRLEWQ